jgi:hypothetical protein
MVERELLRQVAVSLRGEDDCVGRSTWNVSGVRRSTRAHGQHGLGHSSNKHTLGWAAMAATRNNRTMRGAGWGGAGGIGGGPGARRRAAGAPSHACVRVTKQMALDEDEGGEEEELTAIDLTPPALPE